MYELSKSRKYVPQIYRGPPKPLQKDVFINGNITALQLLQKACPEFAYGDDPHVCCSTSQLIATQEHFDMLDALGFSRCPSCFHNFRQLICFLACSPWQSRFMNVTSSELLDVEDSTEEVVVVTELHLSELYAYTFYESCKGLQGLIPGTLILDFVCGVWGSAQCSPERWLEYMGSTVAEGARAPFKTRYILHVEDKVEVNGQLVFPMKAPHFKKLRTNAGLSKRFLSKTIGERFMVKEESAASVGTRPWTPEGRSLTFHCLYALAGYNGMAFTPWVTLPVEKFQTYIAHSTQGHYPLPDEAA
ncbi:NPC1-like intracellular cholesterol transporter 1 [Araneus ventricosus]|uniref:NPC1-like intracellular cholesterol transporter 1 n=1 Tax=Araneus ventricosus TaxID=182803 RepID=A0A4Y2SPD1_ARAVE|nr:NPC1-like intracellular cholesterol transporter 1 [Araneus ventricosus]